MSPLTENKEMIKESSHEGKKENLRIESNRASRQFNKRKAKEKQRQKATEFKKIRTIGKIKSLHETAFYHQKEIKLNF